MNNDSSTMLDTLLETASNKWQVDENFVNELIDKISFHESKGVVDAIQGNDVTKPGRGLFQYEKGYKQGAHTAINRLIGEIGYTPNFLQGITSSDYDISKLSRDEQKILFLADKLQNPSKGTNLGIAMGDDKDLSDEEIADYWVDYHWSGYGDDMELREKMRNKFIEDLNWGYKQGKLTK